MTNKQVYVKKFLVQGSSFLKEKWDICRECRDVKFPHAYPCNPIKGLLFPIEGNCIKPMDIWNHYLISQKEDGTYECSCRAWTSHFPRQDCKHIIMHKQDPKDSIEVGVDWTHKSIATMKKVTGV